MSRPSRSSALPVFLAAILSSGAAKAERLPAVPALAVNDILPPADLIATIAPRERPAFTAALADPATANDRAPGTIEFEPGVLVTIRPTIAIAPLIDAVPEVPVAPEASSADVLGTSSFDDHIQIAHAILHPARVSTAARAAARPADGQSFAPAPRRRPEPSRDSSPPAKAGVEAPSGFALRRSAD